MEENFQLNEILELTLNIREQMQETLPQIRTEIEQIIKRESRDEAEIEKMLDWLLNYGQMGVGEKEFRLLNDYYASFNQENADFYNTFYREMNED